MKEPIKQLDPPLSIEDFQGVDVICDPRKLRGIIEGLRALPNVSDMSVISAIAEFDRIAQLYELVEKRRERINQFAQQLARDKAPELLAIVQTGTIPEELLRDLMRSISPPSPTCDCPRCRAHFGKDATPGNTKQHLNS